MKTFEKILMQDHFYYSLNIFNFAIAAIFSYTGLPLEPMRILAILIAIDTLTGAAKSILVSNKFSTHRLSRGVAGKLGLITVPVVMALAAKGIGTDAMWLLTYALNLILLSEAYSIVANIYTIRTKKEVPEWDVMAILLRKIHEFAESIVGKR